MASNEIRFMTPQEILGFSRVGVLTAMEKCDTVKTYLEALKDGIELTESDEYAVDRVIEILNAQERSNNACYNAVVQALEECEDE